MNRLYNIFPYLYFIIIVDVLVDVHVYVYVDSLNFQVALYYLFILYVVLSFAVIDNQFVDQNVEYNVIP